MVEAQRQPCEDEVLMGRRRCSIGDSDGGTGYDYGSRMMLWRME